MGLLIDAHAHLDMYGEGTDAALSEIRSHRILTIGTSMDVPSYERTVELASRCDLILPAFGVHPWNAPQSVGGMREIITFAEAASVIGEIGLDHYFVKEHDSYPAQMLVLDALLALAREQDKLVNLHTKGAEREVLDALDRHAIKRAIIHWYSGPMDVFHELVSRGFAFTVGVEVVRSKRIRRIARQIPSDQLLTETDNPGAWKWLSGTPGRPANLLEVIAEIAKVRGATMGGIAQTVRENFARLIRDDPWLQPAFSRHFATPDPEAAVE